MYYNILRYEKQLSSKRQRDDLCARAIQCHVIWRPLVPTNQNTTINPCGGFIIKILSFVQRKVREQKWVPIKDRGSRSDNKSYAKASVMSDDEPVVF